MREYLLVQGPPLRIVRVGDMSPVPSLTVVGGARTDPSRKPCRRAPAKVGRQRDFHSMKLLPFRRTAMGGRTDMDAVAYGGATAGPGTVAAGPDRVEVRLGEEDSVSAEVVMAAVAARRRGGGGYARQRRVDAAAAEP